MNLKNTFAADQICRIFFRKDAHRWWPPPPSPLPTIAAAGAPTRIARIA
jgi:hypothetical protein